MLQANVVPLIIFHTLQALLWSLASCVFLITDTYGTLASDPPLQRLVLIRAVLFALIYFMVTTIGRPIIFWLASTTYPRYWDRFVPRQNEQPVRFICCHRMPLLGMNLVTLCTFAFFAFSYFQGEAKWNVLVMPVAVLSMAYLAWFTTPNTLVINGDFVSYHFLWGTVRVRICEKTYINLGTFGRTALCKISHPLLTVNMYLNQVTQNESIQTVSSSTAVARYTEPLEVE